MRSTSAQRNPRSSEARMRFLTAIVSPYTLAACYRPARGGKRLLIPKVTFTNYKRFVNGWLTAADRFIPGLNDATGGRDADWFTGVLVNHPRQSVFDDCRCIGTDHQYPVSTTFRRKGPARNVSQHCNEQYGRQAARTTTKPRSTHALTALNHIIQWPRCFGILPQLAAVRIVS